MLDIVDIRTVSRTTQEVFLSGLGTIYSIGGCVAFEVAKRLGEAGEGHLDHFWRRPTIALMSKPVSRFRFNLHDIPSDFINYFVNDASGAHRKELERLPSGSTVVTDVTRDVFTGVIEIEPGAFVMNPLDGLGIVPGLTKESMTPAILANALRSEPRIIHPLKETDAFLDLWKTAINDKINLLSEKFENILLLEIYFTHKKASFTRTAPFTEKDAGIRNSLLKEMYDYLRENPKVTFVSIDKETMITGRHVAWGGPFYTHFIDETYAIFCDAATSALTQGKQSSRDFLTDTAITRAKKYEDARFSLQQMEIRYREVSAKLEQSQQENAKIQASLKNIENETAKRIDSLVDALSKTIPPSELERHVDIIAEREAELARMRQIALEQDEQLRRTRAAIADYAAREKRLQAEILAARAPLAARLTKSTARQTYGLRRKLGLTRSR